MPDGAVGVHLRAATSADAARVAEVYLASRKVLVACAPLAHSDAEVRDWVAHTLVPSGGVTVALRAGVITGMLSISRADGVGWIDHLYVHPDAVADGIGSRLLAHGLRILPRPVRLYTFAENQRARDFYERRGFAAIAFGDGSENEEGCPDVLYELR